MAVSVKALVVAQVEVGLRAVLGGRNTSTVVVGAHGARIPPLRYGIELEGSKTLLARAISGNRPRLRRHDALADASTPNPARSRTPKLGS